MGSLKVRGADENVFLNNLSKAQFLENELESRRPQEKTAENITFNESRYRFLSENEEIRGSGGILYWMSRDCRVQDNWALLFAQYIANKLCLPLHVCFLCEDAHHLYPTMRHFKFLLEGLKLIQQEFRQLNIGFYLLESSPKQLAEIVKQNSIGGVICDFSPLKYSRKQLQIFLEQIQRNVAVIQVDAHNIVPMWKASHRQISMRKFLRRLISEKLPEFLTDFPDVCKHKHSGSFKTDHKLANVDDAYANYVPKWNVPEVQWGQGPGSEAGLSALHSFISENLKHYGVESDDPSKDCTSKLSPWLHFGHISAQRCALEVKKFECLYQEQCEKFLDELIVRRELSDNYCFYNSNYDNIEGAPKWGIKTLRNHATDKRNWIYTRDQLANAETHDEIWNSAQLQAVREGKIHGHLRLYWCKKILEWTESPEKAIRYSLWLNDTFCLDGTDPSGYVGVVRAICGLHDQSGREREIFGKVQYIKRDSLTREFDMKSYCERFGRKIDENHEEIHKSPRKLKRKKHRIRVVRVIENGHESLYQVF